MKNLELHWGPLDSLCGYFFMCLFRFLTQKARKENLQREALAPSRGENAGKTSKTICTIAILWTVKTIFEKRAATVEVDTFISLL